MSNAKKRSRAADTGRSDLVGSPMTVSAGDVLIVGAGAAVETEIQDGIALITGASDAVGIMNQDHTISVIGEAKSVQEDVKCSPPRIVSGGSAVSSSVHEDVNCSTPRIVSGGSAVSNYVHEDVNCSPPRIVSGGSAVSSPVRQSPSNKDKFNMKLHIQFVGCNLDSVSASPTVRLSFRGTLVILYPPATNPDRRYVIFMDESGSLGVTIWKEDLKQFHSGRIGCLVEISRMSLATHKGQKSLALTKESKINFVESQNGWWSNLLKVPALMIMDVHSSSDNSVVSVSGILALLCTEEKVVRNAPVELLIMRIVDRSGEIEVRSWTRRASEFVHLKDKPILLSRLRVTSYAGTKMVELIDGASGSIVSDSFDGASELAVFWNAPADI
jgi:hypothetical protein